MFSKKVTQIDKIFNVDLTVATYCQIDGEDFVNFCGLLRKRELYYLHTISPSMVLERMQMLLCFVVFMCARTERVVIMVPFFM